MIYHFFDGNIQHLTPRIIKSILQNAKETNEKGIDAHYFCIMLFTPGMKYLNYSDSYLSTFNEFDFKNFIVFENELVMMKYLLKINKYENRILFHSSIPSKNIFKYYALLYLRGNLKACSLVCWGQNDLNIDIKNRIKRLVVNFYLNIIYKNMQNIITLSLGDQKICAKYYPKAKCLYSPYVQKEEEQYLTIKEENYSDETKIMISHSGWPHNNHIKAFKILEKFKNEKIKIICPLCYGEQEYITRVIEYGSKTFKEKFEYFTDIKPRNEYELLVSKIDIYISCSLIQTGLYVLGKTIPRGKRVYIDGNLLASMRDSGFYVDDVNEIEKMTFAQFKKVLSKEKAEENQNNYHNNYANVKERQKKWKNIYEGNI
jgi:dTDP-N-acetylfucosamine:lipid II N-acetylfucosaminyltransferase